MERLQKVIAHAGVTSRRKAEELITQGKVTVDGEVITQLGYQVKKGAYICVNGKAIEKEAPVYYVINKPKKVLCSVNDDRGRMTVVDMVDCEERIYPVGRLDYESSGVLLLTNDGEFANMMIHPRYHIKKTYRVTIKGILSSTDIKQLEKGVMLDEKMTLPCKIWVTDKDMKTQQTTFDITIQEGRNRQIRRMMELCGYRVTKLHRKQFGVIDDKQLLMGDYRRLKPFEVKQLKALANEGKLEQ